VSDPIFLRCAQGEADEAALRVAAAEAVRDRGQAAQQLRGARVVLLAESSERLAGGQSHRPQHSFVGAAVREPPALRAQQAPREVGAP